MSFLGNFYKIKKKHLDFCFFLLYNNYVCINLARTVPREGPRTE